MIYRQTTIYVRMLKLTILLLIFATESQNKSLKNFDKDLFSFKELFFLLSSKKIDNP